MADQLKGQVSQIASSLTDEMANRFAGVMKAVVPDVTKPLAEAAEAFQNQLVKGTGPKVEKAYVHLQSILQKFDVQISDLGKDFQKTSEAFEAIQKSRTIALEEVEKLRERNIVAEAQFIPNVKKNQMEYKAILLTDKQLMKKREELIKDEAKNKEKERKLLEQLRTFQKRDDDNTKKKGESIIKQIQALQLEAQQIQEQKKLYSGKGGRFDTRVGGAIDNFERALQDKAPDFLIAALDPIVNFARQFQKTMTLVVDGFNFLKKSIKLLPDDFKKITSGFSQSFNLFKKNFLKGMGSVIKGLLSFDKKLIVTGLTMLSAIVAPLIPLIVPLLKLAAIVTGVVVAITLLKKGFDALTNWFKNSWLGKKIFGGDKGKEKPLEEKDRGGAGDLSGEAAMFDDDMSYGGRRGKKKKPKVVAKEEERLPVEKPAKVIATEEKDAFGDTQFEAYMRDKEMDAYMKGEETTSMKKNRVRQETEALRKEKIYGDNEAENRIMELAEKKYGGYEKGYDKAKAELFPELAAKEKELEALIKKEEEEKLAAKKEFVEKKVKTKSTQKVTTTETVTGGDETVKTIGEDQKKKIDDSNKIHSEYDKKISDLMDSPEYKRMSADERLSAIVKLENERNQKVGLPPLTAAQIQSEKKGIEFEMRAEKIKPTGAKKDLTLDAGQTGGQPVVINNVTAPQNVASSSTQQVVAANAAKSNDDTFLNLNRHV